MQKVKAGTKEPEAICTGGASFNCKRHEHKRGEVINCFRCSAPMGCSVCVERPIERICLVCHNWAHPTGVKRHGNVVPNPQVRHVRVDSGTLPVWKHWHDGDINPLDVVNKFWERKT
jgi:hypothetical protein